MRFLKFLFFEYQRAMFYAAQAKGEYGKIGSFLPETFSIMAYLAAKNIDPPLWQIPLYYMAIIAIATLIGKFLMVLGVMEYNNKLSSRYAPPASAYSKTSVQIETLERLSQLEEVQKQILAKLNNRS